ncbi:MAG TPA: BON domain-containing protein [Myxococcota bacterium]|nr:BON domain-containing protein [Myxococcota bacterium]
MINEKKRKRKQSPSDIVYREEEHEHSPGEAVHREQERWEERGYTFLPSWRAYEESANRPRERGPFLEEFDYIPERHEIYDDGSGPHAGKGPKNWHRRDERINEDVNERLFKDSWIDASDIQVHVEKGEVTLKGTVEDRASKRRAEDVAESVLGVSQVHNQLRVESRK